MLVYVSVVIIQQLQFSFVLPHQSCHFPFSSNNRAGTACSVAGSCWAVADHPGAFQFTKQLSYKTTSIINAIWRDQDAPWAGLHYVCALQQVLQQAVSHLHLLYQLRKASSIRWVPTVGLAGVFFSCLTRRSSGPSTANMHLLIYLDVNFSTCMHCKHSQEHMRKTNLAVMNICREHNMRAHGCSSIFQRSFQTNT